MKIMNFGQFINEGYSEFNELPKPVKDFFIQGAQKNILSKVIGLRNFSISLEGDNIYFTVNGKKTWFPFINYVGGQVIINTNNLKDLRLVEDFYRNLGLEYSSFNIKDYHERIKKKIEMDEGTYIPIEGVDYRVLSNGDRFYYLGNYERNLESIIYTIFNSLRKVVKEDIPVLNPFTDIDLNDNPFIKLLDKLGVYIDTSEARRKKGILRFSLKNFNYGLIIQPNGYIRKDIGDKTPVLTSKMEISGPMYTEDDLNLKLSYIIAYVMKDTLRSYDIPTKTVNSIVKAYSLGNMEEYNKLLADIVNEYPLLSSVLPDPNDLIDPRVKRGASILGSLGLF